VLRTPELAAQQVAVERRHMPGISEAESSIRHENEQAEAQEAKRLHKEQQAEARAASQLQKEQKSFNEVPPPTGKKQEFNQVSPFTPEEEKLYAP
jgi:hypothetical protein